MKKTMRIQWEPKMVVLKYRCVAISKTQVFTSTYTFFNDVLKAIQKAPNGLHENYIRIYEHIAIMEAKKDLYSGAQVLDAYVVRTDKVL